jgi:hypothetical protein
MSELISTENDRYRRYRLVDDVPIAYVDVGEGGPIVFLEEVPHEVGKALARFVADVRVGNWTRDLPRESRNNPAVRPTPAKTLG